MEYIKQLTFTRYLAALTVLIFHFAPNNLLNIAPLAVTVVSFFFFLSGVVLSFNYFQSENLTFKNFILRRVARIYPVYILALLLTLLFSMFLRDSYPKGISVLLQLLIIQSWVPGKAAGLNFPGWSISVEFFFYALFPLIVYYFRKISFFKIVVITISVWVISLSFHIALTLSDSYAIESKFHQFVLYFPVWHFNTFLFGFLCGIFIKREMSQKSIKIYMARLLYTAGIGLFVVLLIVNHFMSAFVSNGLLSPLYFMIITGISLDKSFVTKLIGNKFFILLGNASYSLYILQWPFFILFTYIFEVEKLNQTLFYTYTIALTIISILVYHFFERPIQKLLLGRWIKI